MAFIYGLLAFLAILAVIYGLLALLAVIYGLLNLAGQSA